MVTAARGLSDSAVSLVAGASASAAASFKSLAFNQQGVLLRCILFRLLALLRPGRWYVRLRFLQSAGWRNPCTTGSKSINRLFQAKLSKRVMRQQDTLCIHVESLPGMAGLKSRSPSGDIEREWRVEEKRG